MFKKILIVEDQDIINTGLLSALNKLNIPEIIHVAYCDEALLKLKSAASQNAPFDVLISDLSFIKDHNPQTITTGKTLIEEVKKAFPELKIIVFSIEDKPYVIQNLQNNLGINAYVWKNRDGEKELLKAIQKIWECNDFYISPDLQTAIHPKNAIEITDYDIHIIKHLSEGILQDDLPKLFKEKDIKPSGKSSIEKRIKFLKEHFNANNPTHLVAIAKDFGLV